VTLIVHCITNIHSLIVTSAIMTTDEGGYVYSCWRLCLQQCEHKILFICRSGSVP